MAKRDDPKRQQRHELYKRLRTGIVIEAQEYETASNTPTEWATVPTIPYSLAAAIDRARARRPEGVKDSSVVVLVSAGDDDEYPRLLIVRDVTDDMATTLLAAQLAEQDDAGNG